MLETIARQLREAGCVFAQDEAHLLAERASGAELERLVARRIAGEPLQHVLGWAWFCDERLVVAPGVFVPRPRTELLASEAVRRAAAAGDAPLVVDLCCGSGAIAAVVAARVPGARIHAADIDPVAAVVARENLTGRGEVHEGDLFDALPARLRGRVDVLAANVPYVPSDEIALMPADARDHEPVAALDGGGDGLDVLRRVTAGAGDWLAPGGCLLSEVGELQLEAALELLRDARLTPEVVRDEELDARVVVGAAPGS